MENIRIKFLREEDFVNYKKPAMFIGLPFCSFKCCKEANLPITVCQNHALRESEILEFPISRLILKYMNNPITEAVVFGGLEPLDSFEEVLEFISEFRKISDDDVIIYTGFKEDEIQDKIETLKKYRNIILKIGRYIPNRPSVYDEILGVELASDNQYGKKVS